MLQTVVDLIRHGEPQGGERYRGQRDDPLSERGWQQLWAAVGDCSSWDVVLSSPLQRCTAFAEALAQRHRLPLEVHPDWKEIGFGAWEGRTAAELQAQDPQGFAAFKRDPLRYTPSGAEPLSAFQHRVFHLWESMLACQRGKRLLLVCHAGTIRAVISHTLSLAPGALFRIQVPYAGITRVRIDHYDEGDRPQLVFHGRSTIA